MLSGFGYTATGPPGNIIRFIRQNTCSGKPIQHYLSTTATTAPAASSHDVMQMPSVVFVIGGPGSGKGTQSQLIGTHHP